MMQLLLEMFHEQEPSKSCGLLRGKAAKNDAFDADNSQLMIQFVACANHLYTVLILMNVI